MQTFLETGSEFNELHDSCAVALGKVLPHLSPTESHRLMEANSGELASGIAAGKLYLLKTGTVSCLRNGRLIYVAEPGELVGLDSGANVHCEYAADFAIVADVFDRIRIFEAAATNAALAVDWAHFLHVRGQLLVELLSAALKPEERLHPQMRGFDVGEVIIEQGDQATHVYTLLEGHAEVFVDGVRVGEVLRDEIFGALSVLTGTTRTARVVASRRCLVASLPKDDFVKLIAERPATTLKLAEDMARMIVSLNRELVSSKQATSLT